jgi:hypothetical protein
MQYSPSASPSILGYENRIPSKSKTTPRFAFIIGFSSVLQGNSLITFLHHILQLFNNAFYIILFLLSNFSFTVFLCQLPFK